MKEKVIELCNLIRDYKCNSCSGEYHNYKCSYCGKENLDLKKLEDDLELLLNNISNYDLDILMALYKIKSFKIDFVSKILEENKVKDYVDNKYNELIIKKDLSNEDYKFLLYCVDNDLFDCNRIVNLLMNRLLNNKLTLSIDEKILLLRHFISEVVYFLLCVFSG